MLTRLHVAFHGHVAGAFENEEGKIVFDLTVADGNVFFFFPPVDTPAGTVLTRNKVKSPTKRWIFDPNSPSNTRVEEFETYDTSGEFPRIDDRYVTKPYNHFWQLVIDPTRPYDFEACGSPAGGFFNCLGHYNWADKSSDVYWAGPRATFQEPTFIPKFTDVEGEGYIILLVNRLDELRNDIAIFDSLNIAKGPLALIKLPIKLRLGLHGNFVPENEIEAWREKRKDGGGVGPAKAASRPLPFQIGQEGLDVSEWRL